MLLPPFFSLSLSLSLSLKLPCVKHIDIDIGTGMDIDINMDIEVEIDKGHGTLYTDPRTKSKKNSPPTSPENFKCKNNSQNDEIGLDLFPRTGVCDRVVGRVFSTALNGRQAQSQALYRKRLYRSAAEIIIIWRSKKDNFSQLSEKYLGSRVLCKNTTSKKRSFVNMASRIYHIIGHWCQSPLPCCV